MTHTDISPTLCPHCGYFINTTSPLKGDDATPSEGDITLCLSCGEVLTFDAGLKIVLADPAMLGDLDDKSQDLLTRAVKFIKRRGPLTHKETAQ